MAAETASGRLLFGLLCLVGGMFRLFHNFLISRTRYWPAEQMPRPVRPRFSVRLIGDLGIILVGFLLLLSLKT
jgi:hypothetical protein